MELAVNELVWYLLSDENGVNEDAYNMLYLVVVHTFGEQVAIEMNNHVDATDGYFYFESDDPEWWNDLTGFSDLTDV